MAEVSLIDGHIDNGMTEEEIIKALKCHKAVGTNTCDECPYQGKMCSIILISDALDLINRQKAEIEKYEHIKTTINEFWDILLKLKMAKRKEKPTLEELAEAIEEIEFEAIKEFAEKVKDLFSPEDEVIGEIENIKKEMTESK